MTVESLESSGKKFVAMAAGLLEERDAQIAKLQGELTEARARIAALTEALAKLLGAVTSQVNEKGAGGFLLARMSDARAALPQPAPGSGEEG